MNAMSSMVMGKVKGVLELRDGGNLDHTLRLWTIVALCTLIPLPFSSLVECGYDLPKATLLLIATIMLGFLWIREGIYKQGFVLPNKPISILVLLAVVSLAISTVLSINPLRSFVGDFVRTEGMIVWIAYFLLFFLVSGMSFTGKEIHLILKALLLGASLVSIFGIAQFFGVGSLAVTMAENSPFETYRPYSTFGNPMMFGQYLALIFPVSLAFALMPGPRNRFMAVIPIIVVGSALIVTFTRGAWLAAAISLIVIVAVYRPKIDAQTRRILLATISIFIVAAVILLGATFSRDPSALSRFNPSEVTFGSVKTRLLTYEVAVKAVKERPLFGYGLENFEAAFAQNRGDAFVSAARFNEVSDRSHNIVLDLAASGGILFLTFFMALIITVFLSAVRSGKESMAIAGILSGAVGYLVSLLSGFSIPGATSLFFIFLGILSHRAMGGHIVRVAMGDIYRKLLPVIATIIAGILIIVSLLPLMSAYYYMQGENLRRARNFEPAIEYYVKAISFFPWYERYYMAAAGSYVTLYVEEGYGETTISEAKKAHDRAIELDPYGSDILFYGGLFYQAYKNLDPEALNKSISLFERQLIIDRYSIPGRLALADTYEQAGAPEKANRLREQAIELSARFGWLNQPMISDRLKDAARKLQASDPSNQVAARYHRLIANQR
ncbi:MAG: O-antigen ligase family protein [Actinobacteria bacterium]|nr:O-antigen ligase family protein [Actinomycetota bacterium]